MYVSWTTVQREISESEGTQSAKNCNFLLWKFRDLCALKYESLTFQTKISSLQADDSSLR